MGDENKAFGIPDFVPHFGTDTVLPLLELVCNRLLMSCEQGLYQASSSGSLLPVSFHRPGESNHYLVASLVASFKLVSHTTVACAACGATNYFLG